MYVPFKYNLKNMYIRWRTTVSTLGAISLVTAVFILVASLYQGISEFYSGTGAPMNALIMRKGATAEMNSQITIDSYNILKYLDEIAKDEKGEPLISAEMLTALNLDRATFEGTANVQIRGIGLNGMRLRPQVKLLEGRMFTPGLREIIVSRTISGRFRNLKMGEKINKFNSEWTVVGIFDGQKSAYDSEIWTDSDELKGALRRENYTIVLAELSSEKAFESLEKLFENDKRLRLTAKKEIKYYEDLVNFFKPIKFIGYALAVVMAVGAVFAAMNTMYTMIHHRTRDIGTLRILGFKRLHILISFLTESVLISVAAGCIGILLAMPMNGYATGTANFNTFSEVVFEFRITPRIMLDAIVFAAFIGFAGGLLPSLSAAGKPILKAIKSS